VKTSEMFPVWPRIITQFIMEATKADLIKDITETSEEKYDSVKKYIKGEEKTGDFAKKVMPDLVLVSPRHLFRMPYSLHEKTALASAVLLPEEISNFQPRDADPLKVKVRNFMPNTKEGEASELIREALDWFKNKNPEETSSSPSSSNRVAGEYQQIKIENFSEDLIPPSIKAILLGLKGDGRKRALFVLINFFRSIGMEKDPLEKKMYEWNNKNAIPLKEGYIKAQLIWSYRNKVAPPPNYDKDHYSAIGIVISDEEKRYKNPVNYTVVKSRQLNFQNEENLKQAQKEQKRKEKEDKQKEKKTKDNFKK
jgi:hypothetical protein